MTVSQINRQTITPKIDGWEKVNKNVPTSYLQNVQRKMLINIQISRQSLIIKQIHKTKTGI